MLIQKNYKQQRLEQEMNRKIREGLIKEQSKEQQENAAALFIQKRLKGILARKQIELLRQEEMYFLGMSRRPKTV